MDDDWNGLTARLSEGFGKQLCAARRDRKLTQNEAASKTGMTRALVIRIEKGENVGVDEVHKPAFALGFTVTLSESMKYGGWDRAWMPPDQRQPLSPNAFEM